MEPDHDLIDGIDVVHVIEGGRPGRGSSASAPLPLALYSTAETDAANSISANALVNRRQIRIVTVEDERQLLGSCPRPLKDVLTIMLDSGLRNGEVIRMRFEYINWESAFYFNPKGKTRKARRLVPLSERVIAILRNIQREQSGQREGWIFPSKKSASGHIGLSGIEHTFRKSARKLGIPDALKLYCARHTFGTVAMAETRNPGLVREVMGHESLDTTMGVSPSRDVSDQSGH